MNTHDAASPKVSQGEAAMKPVELLVSSGPTGRQGGVGLRPWVGRLRAEGRRSDGAPLHKPCE
jgi:hypothetical protein